MSNTSENTYYKDFAWYTEGLLMMVTGIIGKKYFFLLLQTFDFKPIIHTIGGGQRHLCSISIIDLSKA